MSVRTFWRLDGACLWHRGAPHGVKHLVRAHGAERTICGAKPSRESGVTWTITLTDCRHTGRRLTCPACVNRAREIGAEEWTAEPYVTRPRRVRVGHQRVLL